MTSTVRDKWIAEKPARTIGIAIVLLGIELGIVQFSHGFRATDPIVFGIGVVIPFSLSLALGGAGLWIWRGDLSEIQAVRMGIWIVCGAVWMSIVGIGAIMYQTFCGATIHNPLFFLSVFVTYGTIPGLLGGWYDGRSRVQTRRLHERESTLNERNEQLQLVLDAADLGFWDWDLRTGEVTFGGQYGALLGYSLDELHSSPKTWRELIHPDDHPEVRRALARHFDGETDYYWNTHRKRTKDGDWTWIRDVGKVVERDEEGNPLRAIGINEDITDLKERERELQETKERLDLALEGANLGVWDWDMRTGEVSRDERWAGMLGYTVDEIDSTLGGWEDLAHPEDLPRHDEVLEKHVEDDLEYYRCDYRLQAKSGEWKWIRNIGKISDRDENGDPVRAVGIHQDIDERKRAFQQLERKTDQLEALNRVVRHDIRNDMNVIYGWASQLEAHVDEPGSDILDKVLGVSRHVLELTEVAREFVESMGEDDHLELEPTDLENHLIPELEAQREVYPEARFGISGASPSVSVQANEMLSSVFRNLLANAVQHNDSETPEIEIDVETDTESVVVSIADNGPGIPDRRKDAVFGRGERDLESGGTGIGLYLVDRLVDGYGGDVRIEDNEPEGAVFVVRLQRAE